MVSGAAEVEGLESPKGLLSPAPADVVDEAAPANPDDVLPAAEVVIVVDGLDVSVLGAEGDFGEEELADGVVLVVAVEEEFVLFVADITPKPIRAWSKSRTV